jgi:hypothetical protein
MSCRIIQNKSQKLNPESNKSYGSTTDSRSSGFIHYEFLYKKYRTISLSPQELISKTASSSGLKQQLLIKETGRKFQKAGKKPQKRREEKGEGSSSPSFSSATLANASI